MANVVDITIRGIDQTRGLFRNLTRDLKSVAGWTGPATAGIAALSAVTLAGVGVMVKLTESAIENADAMGKLAQKSGLTVEQFTELNYAAKLADVSTETLTVGMKKLSQELVAQGLGFLDLNDEILRLSDEFLTLRSGAERVAFAVDKFGKSGQQLIPILSQGSAALREQFKEANALHQVISTKTALSADEFGDNIQKAKLAVSGLFNEVSARLLPELVKLSEGFLEWVKDSKRSEPVIEAMVGLIRGLGTAALNTTNAVAKMAVAWRAIMRFGGDPFANLDKQEAAMRANAPLGELPFLSVDSEPGNPAHKRDRFLSVDSTVQQGAAGSRAGQAALMWPGVEKDIQKTRELMAGWNRERIQLENDSFTARRAIAELEYAAHQDNINRSAVDEETWMAASLENWRLYAAQTTDIDRDASQKRMEQAKVESDKKSQLLQGFLQLSSQLFGSLAGLAQAFGKKGVAAFKVFATAEALISTYLAAIRAYAWAATFGGPAAGAVAAALATAAGLAQVASIHAVNAAHAGLDYVPAQATYLLQRGERVIQPEQNVRLERFLDSADGGGGAGGAVNVFIDGEQIYARVTRASRDGRLTIHPRAVREDT